MESARASAAPGVNRAVGEEDRIGRAEAYAAEAFEAYSQQDYASAVALYLKAYETVPVADILFNIARIYDVGLGDRPLALRYYRSYVVDPEADAYRLELAFERLAQLEAKKEAVLPASSVLAPARAQPSTFAESSEFWTPWRVGAMVAGTVGLIGVGIGAGFGVAALSDASTAREYCDGNLCRSRRGLDATHSAAKSADIATVSFALGGTLLATGLGLLLLDGRPGEEVGRVRVGAVASGSQLGVALAGGW